MKVTPAEPETSYRFAGLDDFALGGPRVPAIHFLDEHGSHLGVPALRACFPALSRAELSDLVCRYRAVWRKRNRVPRVLAWSGAAWVWPIDFTGPIRALTGTARYVLAVRDLASGRQLLWRAVAAATGEAVPEALTDLFARSGDLCGRGCGCRLGGVVARSAIELALTQREYLRYRGRSILPPSKHT